MLGLFIWYLGIWLGNQNDRTNNGLGYWTRANPDQCLLATRGKPPRKAKNVRRLVVEKRREHSRKPDVVRDYIERLVDGPYLELFARETKPGWDCWGDQVALFDKGTVVSHRPSLANKVCERIECRIDVIRRMIGADLETDFLITLRYHGIVQSGREDVVTAQMSN